MSLEQAAYSLMLGRGALGMAGARQQAEAEAAIYEHNARLYREEAAHKRRLSVEEQRIALEQMQSALSLQRAKYAKSGVQMTGSPLEVQLKSAEIMSADIAAMAYGRQTEARRLESRAQIERFKAKETKKAGRLAALAPLIQAGGQIVQLNLTKGLVSKGEI